MGRGLEEDRGKVHLTMKQWSRPCSVSQGFAELLADLSIHTEEGRKKNSLHGERLTNYGTAK